MDIKYDKKVNSIYFTFKKGKIYKTIKATKNVLVDKDIKSDILGIEIIGNQDNKNFLSGV